MPLPAAFHEPVFELIFSGKFCAMFDESLADDAGPGAGHKAAGYSIGHSVTALFDVQRISILALNKRLAFFWQEKAPLIGTRTI